LNLKEKVENMSKGKRYLSQWFKSQEESQRLLKTVESRQEKLDQMNGVYQLNKERNEYNQKQLGLLKNEINFIKNIQKMYYERILKKGIDVRYIFM
jgi:hypothetical protein